jgi:hypothetical protein
MNGPRKNQPKKFQNNGSSSRRSNEKIEHFCFLDSHGDRQEWTERLPPTAKPKTSEIVTDAGTRWRYKSKVTKNSPTKDHHRINQRRYKHKLNN